MAYQSLYRRYRSGKFSELVGQQHVVAALKNAIAEDRVGHAYLFSGPRGTGKTSTARILGKALNCTNLGEDGEPCCECESCLAFEAGTSYDLQELDAASNNGVEAIRDLISKVALGSPGRTKVYILDEVHMLTAGAENALLKTLEEPPDHVAFVLATTEPHKVVPTIRSRTQHYEFELIPATELEAHVRFVAEDAGLSVDDAMIDHVVRAGGGSARDTLSALDQVVAAGGVPRDDDAIEMVLRGLAASDAGLVVTSVSEALKAGRDPRVIGETMLSRLRDAFLCSMGAPTDHLSDNQAEAAAGIAGQMGPAAITRSLEVLGTALIEMRQAPDPRVDLEVALLRLTRPEIDTDLAALVARLERLEAGELPAQTSIAAASDAVAPESTVAVSDAVAPESTVAVSDAVALESTDAVSDAVAPESTVAVSDAVAPESTDAVSDAVAPESTGTSQDAALPASQSDAGVRPADSARAALAARRTGQAPAPAAGQRPVEDTSSEDTHVEGGEADSPPTEPSSPASPPGATLGARRGSATTAPTPEPGAADTSSDPPVADQPPEAAAPPTTSPVGSVSLIDLERAWDEIRAGLPGRAKSRFSGGRFISSEAGGVVFGLPNAIHRDRCQECVGDVEAVLSTHFGTEVTLQLVVDGDAVAPIQRAAEPASERPEPKAQPEEEVDLSALTDADPDAAGGVDLLTDAFPGAELVENESE